MDPVNERMIFQEVVDAACRPGLAQYFLITPKLLTDLKYVPTSSLRIISSLCQYWPHVASYFPSSPRYRVGPLPATSFFEPWV
jgi:hypothetical protein